MALSGRQWSGVQMLAWYEANQLAMDDRLDSTGGSTAPLPACEKSNLSYVRGCRCDDCREAAAQAKRAWRARTAV